jgi:hypothetical protein
MLTYRLISMVASSRRDEASERGFLLFTHIDRLTLRKIVSFQMVQNVSISESFHQRLGLKQVVTSIEQCHCLHFRLGETDESGNSDRHVPSTPPSKMMMLQEESHEGDGIVRGPPAGAGMAQASSSAFPTDQQSSSRLVVATAPSQPRSLAGIPPSPNDAANLPFHLKVTRSTLLFCFCAAVNSANLGYDIGVSTNAGRLVQASFDLSVVQREIFVGSMNFWSSTFFW